MVNMENLLCRECPNGCNLTLEWENAENIFIAGNKCAGGVTYAGRVIHKNRKTRVHARAETPLFSKEILKAVAGLWQVQLKNYIIIFLFREVPSGRFFESFWKIKMACILFWSKYPQNLWSLNDRSPRLLIFYRRKISRISSHI